MLAPMLKARNWYWAENNKCDQMPSAGTTFAMGYVMLPDYTPFDVEWTSNSSVAVLSTELPRGSDYFALVLDGKLEGAAPRCSGRYTYGATPSTGLVELIWRANDPSPNGTSLVLVHGSGYGQVYVREALLDFREPQSPPPPQPTEESDQQGSILLIVGLSVGIVLLLAALSVAAMSLRLRRLKGAAHV